MSRHWEDVVAELETLSAAADEGATDIGSMHQPTALRELLSPTNRKLTILAGADAHGHQPGLDWFYGIARERQPQLLCFLGDFINRGPLEFIREALLDMRALAPHCFVIPGNWDPRQMLITLDELSHDGMRNLHKHGAFCCGYNFAGLGGSIRTPAKDTPIEAEDEGFADPLRPYLPADVWLLHQPMSGFRDKVASGANIGSEALRALWEEQQHKPLLVLSAHVHECGGLDAWQGCTFVNPGPLTNAGGYGPCCAWIELEADRVSVEELRMTASPVPAGE
jgi:Icc-related predicted phosphoesterase